MNGCELKVAIIPDSFRCAADCTINPDGAPKPFRFLVDNFNALEHDRNFSLIYIFLDPTGKCLKKINSSILYDVIVFFSSLGDSLN